MSTKHRVAILGFGVVGGGVAELITNNAAELRTYLGCEVEIARILDLRDFPDSPFSALVTHDFGDILADESIDTVIEVMGGTHPAYEYTCAALVAGKNVITSNKEVVARHGDTFIRLAAENGVSYRFEAAVGGGIPVIAPLTSSVRQNKMIEVRGILNGTTNYILTKMFTYGEDFDSALRDAQARGYAEANPDADVKGTDAARKITILTALAADILPEVEDVYTEGITGIRAEDVKFAESIGHEIKLLGRCIVRGGDPIVCVAPFLIPKGSPLASVSGVYNAVEVIAEPLGNVMFYGQGAGAGATASAVIGDLIPIIAEGGINTILPGFNRSEKSVKDNFLALESRYYISTYIGEEARFGEAFGEASFYPADGLAVLTPKMTEGEFRERLASLGEDAHSLIKSVIRFI